MREDESERLCTFSGALYELQQVFKGIFSSWCSKLHVWKAAGSKKFRAVLNHASFTWACGRLYMTRRRSCSY